MMSQSLFIFSLQLILLAGIAHQTTVDDESLGQCDKASCPTDTDDVTENESNVLENKLKYSDLKGHLKPFGESGSKRSIPTTDGFPPTHVFFLDYFLPSIPLLMKGAATQFPKFHNLRNDDYLYRLSCKGENRKVTINVEYAKKEIRDGNGASIPFYEFLEIYNTSDNYMVSNAIPMLDPYIFMPCPLQCPQMNDIKMSSFVWFSSGGTTSVVHTDDQANLNCLYRGKKTFIMMDPSNFSVGSIIDNIKPAYSSLDADKVDLNRYPTLRGANFIKAQMEPGDCLYIPKYWIHQVRSYDSNLAINVWFEHKATVELLRKGHCLNRDQICDPSFTYGRIHHKKLAVDLNPLSKNSIELMTRYFEASSFHGNAVVSPENLPSKKGEEKVKIREFLSGLVEDELLPFPKNFMSELEDDKEQMEKEVLDYLDIMKTLDEDGDGILTYVEIEKLKEETWDKVVKMVKKKMKDRGLSLDYYK